ncbi:hypothetical protein ZWY2020_036974 [Hordeum vulgare]|nr:hypothetical protein ZWY2020_036974 [Hordeum vulgare]
MASEARSGGVRRVPLQPRDGNAAASPSLGGAAPARSKAKARAPAASPASVRSYAGRAEDVRRAAAVVRENEVSLAEELEKARSSRAGCGPRGRSRRGCWRRQTRRCAGRCGSGSAGRTSSAGSWRSSCASSGCRRGRGNRGPRLQIPPHMFQGPVTVASTLLGEEAGPYPSDKELLATPTRETTAAATTESSSS